MNFDAHFGSPSELRKLYNRISLNLPSARRDIFDTGVENFEKEREDLRRKAASKLGQFVMKCAGGEEGDKREIKEKIQRKVDTEMAEFVREVASLYTKSASLDDEGIKLTITPETEWDGVGGLKGAGTGGIGGGALGAVLGGLSGLVIGAFGGPTAAATAAVGAKIGGAAGTIIGTLIGSARGLDITKKGKISNYTMDEYVQQCLAFAWAVSHHSHVYGEDSAKEEKAKLKTIPISIITELRTDVKKWMDSEEWKIKYQVDWQIASKDTIESTCYRLFERFII